MEENEVYERLWSENASKLKQNKLELDPYLIAKPDSRMGISLILQLNQNPALMSNIKRFCQDFYKVDPNQFIQPPESLHVTLLSLITCHEDYEFNIFNLNNYVQIIREAISDANKRPQQNTSVKIQFKGLTASPSCILLRGFAKNSLLNEVRAKLRMHFHASELEHTIDSRYSIQTAHSTLIRFREQARLPIKMYKILKSNIDTDFGELESSHCDLVINDWYHTKDKSTLLARFPLYNS